MTKTLIVLIGLLTFSINLAAQADSIMVKRTFFGDKYLQNGRSLTPKKMLDIMADNEEAYVMMNKAKSRSAAANVFSCVGGFLIGWNLGTNLNRENPNWSVAGVGSGFVALAIITSISASHDAKAAIKIYNSGLSSCRRDGMKFFLGVHDHGVGLALRF